MPNVRALIFSLLALFKKTKTTAKKGNMEDYHGKK